MNRDLLYSVIMHTVIVLAAMFASPIQLKRDHTFGEVIRVSAVTMGEITPAPAEPEAIPEVKPPAPVPAEPEDIPISDPTTKPAVEIEKPPEKPKPTPAPPTDQATGESQAASEDQIEVEGASGTGVSGMVIGDSGFNYPWWPSMALNKISQRFRVTINIDGQVFCKVSFEVIKSGRVLDPAIIEPSGIPEFDQDCLNAIRQASPLPPLPRDYLDEVVPVTITFTNESSR